MTARDRPAARATGSARRSSARRAAVLDAVGEFDYDEHLVGGASIDADGDGAHRRGARRLPRRRRRPARRGRRAELGHHRPRRAAPRAGAARAAQGPRPVRQPAPGEADRGAARREPAARASGSRAPTCWSSASSPAGSTSARRRRTATAPATPASTRSRRSSASPGSRSRRRRRRRGRVTSVDKANVLETSRLWRETVERLAARLRRRRARPHAGRQRRDAARLRPDPLRRDRDREHVRRHPLRRGGDAHRLARDAALGEPRRRRPGPVRAGARLGPRHRRLGVANPLATFLSAAMLLRDGLGMETRRPRSKRRSRRRSARACGQPTSPAATGRGRHARR